MKLLMCPDCSCKLKVKEGYPKYIRDPNTKKTFFQTIYQCSCRNSEWIICNCGCGLLAPVSKHAKNKRYYNIYHRLKEQHKRFIKNKEKLPQIGTNQFVSDIVVKHDGKFHVRGWVALNKLINKEKKELDNQK